MTIDGFLQFLGLVVAVYALLGVVSRYRLRLLGAWLWVPSIFALAASIYLLLFDLIGVPCKSRWCSALEFLPGGALTPATTAFIIVLTWLVYVALLPRWKSIGTRQLPLLAALIDRLVAERRFPELIDFIEPHLNVISRSARRKFPLQRLRDAIRWQGNEFAEFARPPRPEPTRFQRWKNIAVERGLIVLKPLEARLPKTSPAQEAALQILRVLQTNEPLVEFVSLERAMFALKLMSLGRHDYDFGDRAFELMMSHPQSQLRRETLLNQNVGQCFYEIDAKNPLIHALLADAKVAEKLEVYRPVGNYVVNRLERSPDYRQAISAAKPREDSSIHRDATYCMIRFFDIMVRSAMRDGIEWHMWLFYLDILVGKLIKSMDFGHPDYDGTSEFPNFGHYLIYEVFDTYCDWLRAIECCAPESPVIEVKSTAPGHENGSILKSAILSIGNSLKHLLESATKDTFVTYILEMLMRQYRGLEYRENGGKKAQEALCRSMLNGGYYGLEPACLARLADCYSEIDPLLRFETKGFEAALLAALA